MCLLVLRHFNRVQLCVTPWTVACQACLSMGFSGKNTGVVCHGLLQGDLPVCPLPGRLQSLWYQNRTWLSGLMVIARVWTYDGISGLIRRDTREAFSLSPSLSFFLSLPLPVPLLLFMCRPGQDGGSCLQAKRKRPQMETYLSGTLILDFLASRSEKIKFCCLCNLVCGIFFCW